MLVRREGVLLDLSDGDGVKKRAKKSGNCEQDPCTIQITHLVLSLSVLSSPLSWCCRSVLPLMRALAAGPVNRAPAGQTRVARGEKGRGVGRSREHNGRNYRQLHTGETPDPLCPCAVDCRARRAPISSTARDFTRRPSSAGSRRRSCNARIAPGLEVPGGIFFNPLGGGALR